MYVDVDRAKAKSMDVPLTAVFDTLQIYLGSAYVNDFTYSVARFRSPPRRTAVPPGSG